MAGQSPDPQRQAARPSARESRAPARDGTGGTRGRSSHSPGDFLSGSRFNYIGRDWVYMSLVVLVVMGLVAFAKRSVLSWHLTLPAALAILLLGATPLFVQLERKAHGHNLLRAILLVVAVGVPMLLVGFALSHWTLHQPNSGWALTLAVLVIINMLAVTLLHGRLASILVAQVMLWAGVVITSGTTAFLVTVAIGTLAAIGTARYQNEIVARDRARQRELEREQRRAEALLAEYEASGQGWFWETDRRGAIYYVSPRIGALLGRRSEALVGRPFTELFILDDQAQESERTLNFHLTARSAFTDLAVRAATEGEEERWWSISGRPTYDEFNNFIGFRGSGSDLTEQRRSQQDATRLARYDSLTGLANRVQMSETLEKILNARREEQRCCAVFLLDLDRFKQVNDTMGHPTGDALLKQVAQRLERAVGEGGQVGRLGGDEFQVVLPGRQRLDDLAQLAQRVIESLSQPYSIEGHNVVIGASVGIAQAPEDGVTSEALIRNADLALYAAKDGGRGRHHFYHPDLHSDAKERRQLEQDLRDALMQGGLELHYQPVVHTYTEKITGFEALLRWHHPQHGPISPAKFIPIAEEAGLIAQIGEWALRTACQDLARWPESVRVAVNVSPLQFANAALPSIVTNALATAQIHPGRLELEITESVFLNDDKSTQAMFTALKGVGVRLALDDFGTGYSSLGYLKKAPFDKIKIDQSFVRGATVEGSRNGALIASIVSLAEALGMETTAEGVETLDELDLVRSLGCSHIQGYIYEKPLSAKAASERLEAGLQAIASGPRSARAARQTMLRKVVLEHGGQHYDATIRNISTTGALVEGLWNVPPGTVFGLYMARDYVLTVTSRWSKEDRMGVEFAIPLPIGEDGRISVQPPRRALDARDGAGLLRKAG